MGMTAVHARSSRSVLGIAGEPIERWRSILKHASQITASTDLVGRLVATAFFEDSTRTRTSFTIAAGRLGATVVDFSVGSSPANKGETIVDTARTLAAMGVEALVVRTALAGLPGVIAQELPELVVINAGDGRHEHPTQALGDALTIAEATDCPSFDLSIRRVAIIGDVGASRVARSNVALLTGLGASVVCAGPPTLVPRTLEGLGCEVCWSMDDAIDGADIVMMLRIQFERQTAGQRAIASRRAYRSAFGMTEERAHRLEEHVLIMHPGPTNRGLEIDPSVADGPRSLIKQQVTNGVRARMAVLAACLSG